MKWYHSLLKINVLYNNFNWRKDTVNYMWTDGGWSIHWVLSTGLALFSPTNLWNWKDGSGETHICIIPLELPAMQFHLWGTGKRKCRVTFVTMMHCSFFLVLYLKIAIHHNFDLLVTLWYKSQQCHWNSYFFYIDIKFALQ